MKKILITFGIMLLMGMLTACGKTTINLNDYVTITTEGYDTMGTATYEFDWKRFEADYADKVQVKKMTAEIKMEQAFGAKPVEILNDLCVDFERGEDENLSNGDVILLKWVCDVAMAKEYFGCNLVFEDIAHTVTGLTEVDIFDPMQYVTITFEGVSPYAKLVYTVDETIPMMEHYQVSFDKVDYLKLGDEVKGTIRLKYAVNPEDFMDEYGMYPGKAEPILVVENVGTYVEELTSIPQELIDEATPIFLEQYNKYIEDEIHVNVGPLKNFEYQGFYFVAYERNLNIYSNALGLIYKATAYDHKEEKDFDFYVVGYVNPVSDLNGELQFGEFRIKGGSFLKRFSYYFVNYVGYETFEELSEKLDKEQADGKNFYTNIVQP